MFAKYSNLNITNITHVVLIPFMNRNDELSLWLEHMIPYLDNNLGKDKYYIFIINQNNDKKLFNKGALVNIGFLKIKKIFKEHYVNIQIIIHDVDIYINKDNPIDYNTKRGVVKHPYGVKRPQFGGVLGGIVIIFATDYELSGGMANYMGWGGEDISLYRRCVAHDLVIDENNFIERRTLDSITDINTKKNNSQLKLNKITDKLNITSALKENNKKPFNTFKNISYKLVNLKEFNKKTIYFSVDFEIY